MKKVFIIGREPSSQYLNNGEIPIILNDTKETQSVSRNHAKITIDEYGDMFIDDLGSTSGTFLNGIKVTHTMRVENNCNITLGKTFQFHLTHPVIQNALRGEKKSTQIDNNFEYATWGQRLGGYLLDSLFVGLMMLPLNLLMETARGDLRDIIPFIFLIGFFLIIQFYYAMPISKKGTTFGRKMVGVKYLDEKTKEFPSAGQVWGRLFSYFISAIILYIGFFMPLWTEKKQALHDMIAGTIVVKN